MPDGHLMRTHDDVGWTTYARIVRKPGLGWHFIGYSTPKWGTLWEALNALPQSLDEQNRLYFAEPGGRWERV
jgi:hypothetical protein